MAARGLPESRSSLSDGGHKDANVALLASLAARDVDPQPVLVLQQVQLADQAFLEQGNEKHKRLTERFLIRRNETECKFSRGSSSTGPEHYKNKQIIYLLLVGFF